MHEKKVISKNILVQDTIFKQATGLMFKRNMSDFAMIFPFKKPRRANITMCCVFFPIDVLFVDDRNIIIEYKKDLKSFQNYSSKSKEVSLFIELPEGTISKLNLSIGSRIKWDKNSIIFLK